MIVDGKPISFTVCDTLHDENEEDARAKMYSGADVVVICYSFERPTSFENVAKKWVPELKKYCPAANHFVIACKLDLKTEKEMLEGTRPIPVQPLITRQQVS